MTFECTPAVARAVAARLTSAFSGVDTAATSLFNTALSNGTNDLTMGMSTLTSESVEEIGLVVSVLENLASSIEGADAFSGADAYFTGKAGEALTQLLGSLSDGRGDYGGGTPRDRVDRLIDDIWPDGVPPGLSDEDLVNLILTDPRTETLTPEEIAAIWPLLPEAGREVFAGAQPVTVLDLVVDGGLVLTDAELDAAAQSVYSSPPTMDVDIDPELAALLADASAGASISHDRRVDAAIARADILIAAGQDGREFRDAENFPITYLSLVLGLQSGGTAYRTDDGLIVVVVPRGATVSIDDVLGTDGGGFKNLSFQPFGNGGTTYGNTFIVPERKSGDPHSADLLGHETIHTYQWAGAGPIEYGPLYLREAAESAVRDFAENSTVSIDVAVDAEIVTVDVGPIGPGSAGGWGIPGTNWNVPTVPLPRIDPPAVPVGVDVNVDVDVETDIRYNTGCTNKFEQHADLDDGGYGECLVDP